MSAFKTNQLCIFAQPCWHMQHQVRDLPAHSRSRLFCLAIILLNFSLPFSKRGSCTTQSLGSSLRDMRSCIFPRIFRAKFKAEDKERSLNSDFLLVLNKFIWFCPYNFVCLFGFSNFLQENQGRKQKKGNKKAKDETRKKKNDIDQNKNFIGTKSKKKILQGQKPKTMNFTETKIYLSLRKRSDYVVRIQRGEISNCNLSVSQHKYIDFKKIQHGLKHFYFFS